MESETIINCDNLKKEKTLNESKQTSEPEVTLEVLKGWINFPYHFFMHGVVVLKVTSHGRLVRRTVFLGAKPEYFEISSSKLFDVGYHILEVQSVVNGCDSPDFESLKNSNNVQMVNPDNSCVIRVESRCISLIFMTADRRRDFVFLMRVESLLAKKKYARIKKETNEKITQASP